MSAFVRLALVATLVAATASVPTAVEAGEYAKCEGKKDATKCNKKYEKWLNKEKARSTPMKPSMLNEKLEPWDADGKNPFATDD